MALTPLQVKNAKAFDKPLKLSDGGGLFLLVQSFNPNDSKYWRLSYRFAGKQKTLALGVYPAISLSFARDRREKARKLLAYSADPSVTKKAKKIAVRALADNSFEIIAREWFMSRSPNWKKDHSSKIIAQFEKDIFPWLGARLVEKIISPVLLAAIKRIENRGALETAHRILSYCEQIFCYAIATGRALRDPTTGLRGALSPMKEKHHVSITAPKLIGKLLRNIEGYQGAFITRCALQLASLVFLRPGELRKAEWAEIDLDKAEWRISAARMKMDVMHIVPLASQSVAILREIQPLTSTGKYVFPSARTTIRPMSKNAVLGALRSVGYITDEMNGHGYRGMVSILLNEQGWNRDAIERQLAHGGRRDGVRAVYNYTAYLLERRKMMQAWADYLDKLRADADVVPLSAYK